MRGDSIALLYKEPMFWACDECRRPLLVASKLKRNRKSKSAWIRGNFIGERSMERRLAVLFGIIPEFNYAMEVLFGQFNPYSNAIRPAASLDWKRQN
jgi:hypothetical protein